METNHLTKRQLELIADLQFYGYGWAKFATNVQLQGWCSENQEQTMERMLQKVINMKKENARKYNSHPSRDLIDIDECTEAGYTDHY